MNIKMIALILLASTLILGCAATGNTTNSTARKEVKPKVYDPSGVWEYVVETPDGGSSGVMKIGGSPGAYTASLETDQFGVLEVTGVSVQDKNLTGSIQVMGTSAEIECAFDGDAMTGAVYLGQDAFPMSGKRVSK